MQSLYASSESWDILFPFTVEWLRAPLPQQYFRCSSDLRGHLESEHAALTVMFRLQSLKYGRGGMAAGLAGTRR